MGRKGLVVRSLRQRQRRPWLRRRGVLVQLGRVVWVIISCGQRRLRGRLVVPLMLLLLVVLPSWHGRLHGWRRVSLVMSLLRDVAARTEMLTTIGSSTGCAIWLTRMLLTTVVVSRGCTVDLTTVGSRMMTAATATSVRPM